MLIQLDEMNPEMTREEIGQKMDEPAVELHAPSWARSEGILVIRLFFISCHSCHLYAVFRVILSLD